MSRLEQIEHITAAIKTVKRNAENALASRDYVTFDRLMGDKIALSSCLETEVEQFLNEVEQMKKVA